MRHRPINYNGRYTLPRDEDGNLIIPTKKTKETQVSLPAPLDKALPEPIPQRPQWKYPPNYANWLGGWLQSLKIKKPSFWLAAKLALSQDEAKEYHIHGWLRGFTLPSPWRFLQICKIIAIMSKRPLSEVIQEAAEACFRSTGAGYKTAIGYSEDSLVDLS